MPAAIPYIVYAIGTYFSANAVVAAVAYIIASALVSNYQKRKAQRAARDAYNASLEDRLVMTATANAARSFVYGRARNVDGIVFKGTWGPNKEFYTLVVSVAGHPIDGFETIYLNDQPVTLVSDGVAVSGGADGGVGYYVTSLPYGKTEIVTSSVPMTVSAGSGSVVLPETPIAGSVSVIIAVTPGSENFDYSITPVVVGNTVSVSGALYNGVFTVNFQYSKLAPTVRIWKYKGELGQTLYPLLSTRFPGLLNANDKFSGMAIIVAELTYDQDVFPTGVPSVTAVMRGAKILDTRTGVTAWSENPAMIARAWALNPYGGGCTVDDLNEASFQNAANACDTVTVFNTTAGNETRPLYQCGIVCKTDVNPDDHFGEMVEAMAGGWGFAGGKIKVKAGVSRAAVAAITDIWLNDKKGVNVVKDPSKQDLVNNFKPVISNADGYIDGVTGPVTTVAYTSTPMPNVRSQTFIDADGQELTRETVMLGVTRNVHAQHICAVQMRDMRDGMLVQLGLNMRGWPLELFDVVTLTLPVWGFNAKLFEVLGWKYTLEEGVQVTLKETAPSIYQVDGGLEVLDAALNTELPLPWLVEQVTGVSVVSGTVALEDGWPTTRTEVTWSAVVDQSVRQSGSIEIQYTLASSALPAGDWPAVYEQGNSTKTVITGLLADKGYVFRVRAKNTLGVAGPWGVQKGSIISPPPLVDTPIIEEEAATETMSSQPADGSSSSLVNLLPVLSYTNITTNVVSVQVEYGVKLTASTGTCNAAYFITIDTAIIGGGVSPQIGTTQTSVTSFKQVNLNPGSVMTAYMNLVPPGAGTVAWQEAIVRMTIIKK